MVVWTGPTVAMETTGALEEQINRRKVANHDINIVVEALFQHLGACDNDPLLRRALRIFADEIADALLPTLPFVERKASVEQHARYITRTGGNQRPVDGLRVIHPVADTRNRAAIAYLFQQSSGFFFGCALLPESQDKALLAAENIAGVVGLRRGVIQ